MENRFNLIDEHWIPVAGKGRASLRDIFSDFSAGSLGGNAVQKISILKLLLAIAQSAFTPEDNHQWRELGPEGMAEKCLSYLDSRHDRFWLYGEHPFLQMPVLAQKKNVKGKEPVRYRKMRPYLPDVSSANDSIVFDIQIDRELSDAEKAVMLVSLMNYAPGGKRVENIGALSDSYTGKGTSAKSGPSLGNYVGYLNTCLWSDSIINTVYLNLFTKQSIRDRSFWKDHSIIPPWDNMPQSEDDAAAQRIKNSVMSSLCALSRFVLFTEQGMIYAEGIQYPSHKEGWREPFLSWNSKDKFLWINTDRKPWRNVAALLNVPMSGGEDSFSCPQISDFWNRSRKVLPMVGIWSGGLQVRGTAGDQSVKQKDDFVESFVLIPSDVIGDLWFAALNVQLQELERKSKNLWASMTQYYKEMKVQDAGQVPKAQYEYWEMTEGYLNDIFVHCQEEEKMSRMNRAINAAANGLYNKYCPSRTARQMTAWAMHRPYFSGQKIQKKENASA